MQMNFIRIESYTYRIQAPLLIIHQTSRLVTYLDYIYTVKQSFEDAVCSFSPLLVDQRKCFQWRRKSVEHHRCGQQKAASQNPSSNVGAKLSHTLNIWLTCCHYWICSSLIWIYTMAALCAFLSFNLFTNTIWRQDAK